MNSSGISMDFLLSKSEIHRVDGPAKSESPVENGSLSHYV